MFSKLIRRLSGSLCLVFAGIFLVAIFDVVKFTTADFLASLFTGLMGS